MAARIEYGEYRQRNTDLHPPALTPAYKTSVLRSPRYALISLQNSLSEITGPVFDADELGPLDHDLILNYAKDGAADRRADHRPRPCPGRVPPAGAATRWSSSGRRTPAAATGTRRIGYIAPIDPNFGGCGRMLTDADGYYFFRTIKPGAYPWRNWVNDWRPGAHPLLDLRQRAWRSG